MRLEFGYVKGCVRVVGVEPDGTIVPTPRSPTSEVSSPFDQNVTSVPSSNFHVTLDADVEAHDSQRALRPLAPLPGDGPSPLRPSVSSLWCSSSSNVAPPSHSGREAKCQ